MIPPSSPRDPEIFPFACHGCSQGFKTEQALKNHTFRCSLIKAKASTNTTSNTVPEPVVQYIGFKNLPLPNIGNINLDEIQITVDQDQY